MADVFNAANPELYNATRTFVADAANLVRAVLPSAEVLVADLHARLRRSLSVWLRDDPVIDYMRKSEATLRALPSYGECVRLIRADPRAARFPETLVGWGGNAHRVEMSHLIDSFVYRVKLEFPACEIDWGSFDSAYQRFEASYLADDVVVDMIAPLPSLTLEASPVVLSPSLRLEKLAADDLQTLHYVSPRSDTAFIHFGAVSTRKYRIEFGMAHGSPQPRALDSQSELRRLRQTMLIFRSGNPGMHGILHRHRSWFEGGIAWSFDALDEHGRSHGLYLLSSEDASQLARLWSHMESPLVQSCAWLQVAIRWFEKAMLEWDRGDRLLALMIAAEALFLQSEAEQTTELSYRLSMRAAQWLAFWGRDGRQARKLFKKAYHLRSKIAHGEAGRENPRELCDQIEDALRLSLTRAIEATSSQQPDAPIGRWEDDVLNLFAARRRPPVTDEPSAPDQRTE